MFNTAVLWFHSVGKFWCTTLPVVPAPVRSEDNTPSVGVPTQERGAGGTEKTGCDRNERGGRVALLVAAAAPLTAMSYRPWRRLGPEWHRQATMGFPITS